MRLRYLNIVYRSALIRIEILRKFFYLSEW
jgi:hypothetical protein